MKRVTPELSQAAARNFKLNPPGFEMRCCTLIDLDALLAIGQAAFAYDTPTSAEFRHALTRGHGAIFGLYDVDEKQYAGYMALEAHRGRKNLYINTTVLLNAYRSRGLGQALYTFKDFFAAALGAKSIWGHVAVDNAANIHLMKKNGYQCIRQEDEYYDDGKAALVMRKNYGA